MYLLGFPPGFMSIMEIANIKEITLGKNGGYDVYSPPKGPTLSLGHTQRLNPQFLNGFLKKLLESVYEHLTNMMNKVRVFSTLEKNPPPGCRTRDHARQQIYPLCDPLSNQEEQLGTIPIAES